MRLGFVERAVWAALAFGTAALGWWFGSGSHTGLSSDPHAHHAASFPGRNISAAQPCRQGAFVQAVAIIASVVEVANALPADTPPRTRAELDTVLFTSFKQADSEAHCVAGVLSHGYDQAYASTVQRGVDLAHARGLGKDVEALGEEVVRVLRANKPVNP